MSSVHARYTLMWSTHRTLPALHTVYKEKLRVLFEQTSPPDLELGASHHARLFSLAKEVTLALRELDVILAAVTRGLRCILHPNEADEYKDTVSKLEMKYSDKWSWCREKLREVPKMFAERADAADKIVGVAYDMQSNTDKPSDFAEAYVTVERTTSKTLKHAQETEDHDRASALRDFVHFYLLRDMMEYVVNVIMTVNNDLLLCQTYIENKMRAMKKAWDNAQFILS